jgi:acyl-coenzyme A synthetase/AMP-(fatty) acid ligase
MVKVGVSNERNMPLEVVIKLMRRNAICTNIHSVVSCKWQHQLPPGDPNIMSQRLKYGILQEDGVLCSAIDVPIPGIHSSHHLWDALTAASEKTILVDAQSGQEYTGNQVKAASSLIANMLTTLGVKEGQVVSCCCQTSVLYACSVLGIMFAGAAYAGSYFNHLKQEWQHEVQDTKASVLMCSPDNLSDAHSIADSLDFVHGIILLHEDLDQETVECSMTSSGKSVVSVSLVAAIRSRAGSLERSLVHRLSADKALSYIPFSSGSTGMPKAVAWTSRSLLTNIIAIQKHNDAEDRSTETHGDIVQLRSLGLSCMPGLYQLLVGILSHHQLVIANASFIDAYWDIMIKFKCTHSIIVTSELIHVTGTAPDGITDHMSLRQVETLGSPLPVPVAEAFRKVTGKKVRVTTIYGSVEGGFTTRFPHGVDDLTTVGSLLSHVKMRVRSTKSHQNLPIGEMGELQVRGDQVCSGYLNNEEATEENFVPGPWFWTGDVGFIDSDGLIHVVARLKHIIKFEGYQVAPAELESILMSHDSVSEAVVIGIPDAVHDEVLKAFVVLKEGINRAKDMQDLAAEIRAFVDDQVADIKQLRGGITFLDRMPCISFGKVDRNALKKLHRVTPDSRIPE